VSARWSGAALVSRGTVESAGWSHSHRPLAVMQPGPRTKRAYLVVGTHSSAELMVIALPELTLVHLHVLDGGIRVAGLAGDPSGSALVVCDFLSPHVHVLPWPLEGMSLS
jgi:hypothetical protein